MPKRFRMVRGTWQSSHMGEGLTSGRLDLIGRYMNDAGGEPPQAPPWRSEAAPAPSESAAERLRNVEVECDHAEVTAHTTATLTQSTDSLHRFHETYDRIAGATMLAQRAQERRAASDVERLKPAKEEDEDELQHLVLVRVYTRRKPGA